MAKDWTADDDISATGVIFELVAQAGLAIQAGSFQLDEKFLSLSATAVAKIEAAQGALSIFRVQELLVLLAGSFALAAYASDSEAAVNGWSFIDWCANERGIAITQFLSARQEMEEKPDDNFL
jgi:hypothetical protein